MLKSRIQCIPVYTQHLDQTINIDDLQVRVNVHNDTDAIIILTTEHFQVFNKRTNQLLPENEKQKIFPKNEQTNMYIDLVRLHPSVLVESIQNNISNSMTSSHAKQNFNSGDEIEFYADLVYATANEDAAFNSTCTCTYSYTPDPKKLEKEWKFKQKQYASANDAKAAELDWKIIHAQKFYVPNSFDFIIESVGPYTNEAILLKACDIIQEKLSNTVQFLFENADTNIYLSNKISQYCYDVSFPDSYTIGKLFEDELFSLYFQQSQSQSQTQAQISQSAESSESTESSTITYCAFVKEHPHTPNSIIRIAFPNQTENTFIIQCFDTAFKSITKKMDHIRKYF